MVAFNVGVLPGLFGAVTCGLTVGTVGALGNATDTGSIAGLFGSGGIGSRSICWMTGGVGTCGMGGSAGKSKILTGFGSSLPASEISFVALVIAAEASLLSDVALALAWSIRLFSSLFTVISDSPAHAGHLELNALDGNLPLSGRQAKGKKP